MKITIIDTETTGLPLDMNAPVDDLDNWPRIVGIAWQTWDEVSEGCFELETEVDHIIKPEGFRIPAEVTRIHGISHEHASAVGASFLAPTSSVAGAFFIYLCGMAK